MFWICTEAAIDWKAVSAVGQLTLGLAVGYVAFRQWRTAQAQAETARRKLRADLFDRRFAAYRRIVDICDAIYDMPGTIEDHRFVLEKWMELERLSKEIGWIFDAEISRYAAEEVVPYTWEISALISVLEECKSDPDIPVPELTLLKAKVVLQQRLGELTKLMDPYLKVGH